jgi:iron(III) transport system ATP-binding protein
MAGFLGEANLVAGVAAGRTAQTMLGAVRLRAGLAVETAGGSVVVLIRPEQIVASSDGAPGIPATVLDCEYHGHDAVLTVRPDATGHPGPLRARTDGVDPIAPGTAVTLTVRGDVLAWGS